MCKEKMWKSKAAMMQKILKSREIEPIIVDIGAGYGVFADVMKETTSYPLLLIEPSVHLAKILRGKGYEVLEQSLEPLTLDKSLLTKSASLVSNCLSIFMIRVIFCRSCTK